MDAKDLKTNMRVKHKENGRTLKFVGRGCGNEYCFITIGGSFTSSDFLTAEQVENYEPIFKKKRQKPKTVSTTSVLLGYNAFEDGKMVNYTVKRVIGFTVRTEDSTVNITSEKLISEGLVVRENTTIKFSELMAVHFLSPTDNLTFVFEGDKLISKIQRQFKENFVEHR